MKRMFLSAAGLFFFLCSHAQATKDTTGYSGRKLKIEEVNLVTSYYTQDGNNAAVTGGKGSEKLNDISGVIDVKLTKYDRRLRKHSIGLEVGIDHYTSASSDMIDLKANSSASHADTRIYPSLSWSVENEAKGRTFGAGASLSTEFDYKSIGANILFAQKTKNRNGEFTVKLQTYFDKVSLIAPIELRINTGGNEEDYPTTSRNTFSASLSYSQIVNERMQLVLLADVVQQQGYLGLPFHRVYFTDGSVHQESLPDNRLKVPLGFRASYFLGDRFIVKAYYRFYTDNWGITAHTANIELPVKITPFLSLSPFYRYYTQSATKYFAGFQEHTAQKEFYTSNYDLSAFKSNFYGTGIRIAPPNGVLGIDHFSMIELRYGHYTKDIGMSSNVISMNLKFK